MTPIYSTDAMVTQQGFWGSLEWDEGMNYIEVELSLNSETGSLIPVIDNPISHDLTGWNELWAGYEISFGEFDDITEVAVAKSIIKNTIDNLTTSIIWKYFYDAPIREYQFKDNTYLETIELYALTPSIGASAFEGCTSLTSFSVQRFGQSSISMLTSIGSRAFYGCTALEEITLVYYFNCSIGDYAFAGCTSLATITVLNTNPPTLGTSVFDTTSLQHIYVPASAVNTYKAAAGWSAYASYITAIPS